MTPMTPMTTMTTMTTKHQRRQHVAFMMDALDGVGLAPLVDVQPPHLQPVPFARALRAGRQSRLNAEVVGHVAHTGNVPRPLLGHRDGLHDSPPPSKFSHVLGPRKQVTLLLLSHLYGTRLAASLILLLLFCRDVLLVGSVVPRTL